MDGEVRVSYRDGIKFIEVGTPDFAAFPEWRQDFFCMDMLRLARRFFEQPGVQEKFEAWKRERKRKEGAENEVREGVPGLRDDLH